MWLRHEFFRPCGTLDRALVVNPALKRWAITKGEGMVEGGEIPEEMANAWQAQGEHPKI
jgi:hypothetical protein